MLLSCHIYLIIWMNMDLVTIQDLTAELKGIIRTFFSESVH
jgi:hypothetical protein